MLASEVFANPLPQHGCSAIQALQHLYLDKNLIWHSLVQAYSRTNRVGKVAKQFGQIITFRNIKKWQDEARTLFSGDGDPNEYLLEDCDYYVSQWLDQASVLRKIAPDDSIRQRLAGSKLGLLRTTALMKAIRTFVEQTYRKYKAEGQ